MIKGMFDLVCEFCKDFLDILVIFMGYYNLIYSYGLEKFVVDVKDVGVDGMIIVDLFVEEDDELCLFVMKVGFVFICLVLLIVDDDCLLVILKNLSGFVYYVLINGIIGVVMFDYGIVGIVIECICEYIDLLIVVGFGVKIGEYVVVLGVYVDGVVVGIVLIN